MRVYGLDFTSSPSVDKPLTLAVCQLDDGVLNVETLAAHGNDERTVLPDGEVARR